MALCSITVVAKSYDLTLSPCDKGTNCTRCYEVVKVSYLIDANKKQVTVLGKGIEGNAFKQTIDKCEVIDRDNWSCDSFFMTIQAKSGAATIINKPTSSLVNDKKEICLVRH